MTDKKKKSNLLDDLEADIEEDKKSEPDREELLSKIKKLESSKSTFEAILNISASINSTLHQRELLKKIVDAVISTTDSDRGFLMLRNDIGEYSFEISRSKDEKELNEEVFEVSRSVVERAAETGEPQSFENIQDSEILKWKESVQDLKLGSAYSVPLKYEDKLIGNIYVDSKRISERFTKADLPVLKAFGAQAAVAIENTRRRDELESSLRKLKKRLTGRFEFSGIIGKSESMSKIVQAVEKVAALPGFVFIHGESGVGKELVANAIHYNSPRKGRAFQAVNCGAIADGVIQSMLFGHKKGAFTTAERDQMGAFEAADGGTLFLDEITEIPMKEQSNLLRVLEENEVTRVGETVARKVDVRVVTATNKDLMKEVDAGRFRRDLYYRIYVLSIHVPPLRERPEDIPVLAEHFLSDISKLLGIARPNLADNAVDLLQTNKWDGNVRQLKNLLIRTLSMDGERETIDADIIKKHLEKEDTGLIMGEGDSLKDKIETYEAQIIRQTLILHTGNKTKAAEALKISRQVLHNKIDKYKQSKKL